MRNAAETSVLRRMAGLRADPARVTGMTAEYAMRRAAAKSGEEALGISVGVRDVVADTHAPEVLSKALPEQGLLMRLQGPGDSLGLAVACPQVVAAVIEAQTLGRVQTGAAPARRATRTDAALLGSFLTPILRELAEPLSGRAGAPFVQGFTCGAAFLDARAAEMALYDTAYRCFSLRLDFDNGAKTGDLKLVFPFVQAPQPASRLLAENRQATMENAILGSATKLQAVLCRVKVPLADVAALAVGDCLTLAGATLDGVDMVGPDGTTVMRARLGRSGADRAIRLHPHAASPLRQPSDGPACAQYPPTPPRPGCGNHPPHAEPPTVVAAALDADTQNIASAELENLQPNSDESSVP